MNRNLYHFLFLVTCLYNFSFGQIYGDINIFVEGPVKLLVINSEGRKAGYDPNTNEYYKEIPNTAHGPMGLDSQIPGEKPIEGWDFAFTESIYEPFEDNYKLKIFGTKNGTYKIAAGMSQTYKTGTTFKLSGTIDSLQVVEYEFFYTTNTTKTLCFRKYEPPSGIPTFNVKLVDSQWELLTGGMLEYYDGSWQLAVDNGDGTFTLTTSRPAVSLRMSYEGGSETRQNVLVTNDTVVFQTTLVKVQLQNSQGLVQYYAGGWRDFGITSGGVASKELLPLTYIFRGTYQGVSTDLQQDISQNSSIIIQLNISTK